MYLTQRSDTVSFVRTSRGKDSYDEILALCSFGAEDAIPLFGVPGPLPSESVLAAD